MTDIQEPQVAETEVITDTSMTEEADSVASELKRYATDDELTDLPVSLVVKLPEVSLPIDAMRAMTQGTIVPLNLELTERMHIEINGQKFGEGCLVQIGDKVGIQIETWKTVARRH